MSDTGKQNGTFMEWPVIGKDILTVERWRGASADFNILRFTLEDGPTMIYASIFSRSFFLQEREPSEERISIEDYCQRFEKPQPPADPEPANPPQMNWYMTPDSSNVRCYGFHDCYLLVQFNGSTVFYAYDFSTSHDAYAGFCDLRETQGKKASVGMKLAELRKGKEFKRFSTEAELIAFFNLSIPVLVEPDVQ